MSHTIDIRVYYEDTDAGGVVYHSNYLNFAERGRTEFLRAAGFTNSDIAKDHNLLFVVRKAEVDYLLPAHLDDALTLETSIEYMKNSSFAMRQKLYRHKNAANEMLISDMCVTLVCVDTQKYRPVRIPDFIKNAFETIGITDQ